MSCVKNKKGDKSASSLQKNLPEGCLRRNLYRCNRGCLIIITFVKRLGLNRGGLDQIVTFKRGLCSGRGLEKLLEHTYRLVKGES